MKFVLSNGKYFRDKLQSFPFAKEFVSSKVLVVCIDDYDNIVGVCGIRSPFNVAVSFVRKDYRGIGVGSRQLKLAIKAAEKRPPYFVTSTVSSENVRVFHIGNKIGFREVFTLKRTNQVLRVSTTTRMGRLAYVFFYVIGHVLPNNILSYVHWHLYNRSLKASTVGETRT